MSSHFSSVSFQNFPANVIPTLLSSADAVQLNIRSVGIQSASTNGSNTQVNVTVVNQHNMFLVRKTFQMRNRINANPQSLQAQADLLSEIEESSLIAQEVIQQKEQQLIERVGKKAPPWSVYAGPISSFGQVKDKGSEPGLGYYTVGALGGFDTLLPDHDDRSVWLGIGSVVEYRKKFLTAHFDSGETIIEQVHGSVYGTLVPKRHPHFALEGVIGYAFDWDYTKRAAGSSNQLQATSHTNESIFDALVGIEYEITKGKPAAGETKYSLIPLFQAQYLIDRIGSYREEGAGVYNLQIDAQTIQSFSTILGARFVTLAGGKNNVRIELDAFWWHECLPDRYPVVFTPYNFTSASTTNYTVASGRNSAQVTLDILTTISGGWQIELLGSYVWNPRFYDANFYLGFGRFF